MAHTKYTRYELQQETADKKNWRRVYLLRTEFPADAIKHFKQRFKEDEKSRKDLEWLIKLGVAAKTGYRIVRCDCTVVEPDFNFNPGAKKGNKP